MGKEVHFPCPTPQASVQELKFQGGQGRGQALAWVPQVEAKDWGGRSLCPQLFSTLLR